MAVVSGWSGLYENEHGAEYALLVAKPALRHKIAKLLRRNSGRVIGEKLTTLLTDSTPSSTASVTMSRACPCPDNSPSGLGGARLIVTRQFINDGTATAVTAADKTDLAKMLEGGVEQDSQPTYAADASGNGGGGKLGF